MQDAINRHEVNGTRDDPEYIAAIQVFFDRHICRVVPTPPEIQGSFDNVATDSTVYHAMIGANELLCTGSLHEWSVIDQVHHIIAAALVISGRYYEVTPETARPFAEGIPGAFWAILENSSHMPFVEESEPFFELVNRFLAERDQRQVLTRTSCRRDPSRNEAKIDFFSQAATSLRPRIETNQWPTLETTLSTVAPTSFELSSARPSRYSGHSYLVTTSNSKAQPWT
jgi:hypothetical protein